jgi:hypothetical protein
MKSELHEAINEVFKKIADWFQVPQTGFVSATIRNLCQIILIELNRENAVEFLGDSLDTKYTGISVHRLYDCLVVLLKNAHMHGDKDTPILVDVYANKVDMESVLDVVSIDITSTTMEDEYFESKTRVLSAVDSTEAGIDMVTEGYTGIKKVKFITRASEGRHTLRCDFNDTEGQLKLGFTMHMETASDSGGSGAEL